MKDQQQKRNAWIDAMRLRTLPLAASSIIAGSAMAWHRSEHWGAIFFFALLTTLLLQILSNLANDYGDFLHGVDDAERLGPARALQCGLITKIEMKRALLLFAVCAFLSGMALLYVSFSNQSVWGWPLLFFILGILTIYAAIRYTVGKNPYGYRGIGDISVFFFFGLVGVCGTQFLHTKQWDTLTLLPAISVGLFSTAVLNLNNLRDYENDRNKGKKTLVVLLGFSNGKRYHTLLLTNAVVSVILWILLSPHLPLRFFVVLPFLLLPFHLNKVRQCHQPIELDTELKKIAVITFAYAVLLLLVHFV